MASLIPLINELLPMIIPSSIHITKGSDLLPLPQPLGETSDTVATPAVTVFKSDAIVDKSDRLCATMMVIKPKSSSTVHHHGEQDAILYVAFGTGALLTSPKDEGQKPQRHELAQGDVAYIPCWTEHQVANDSEEADMRVLIVRNGSQPVEVDLIDFGEDQLKKSPQN